ncbi:MAG: GNAT family N-acetyltransferase, partial [Sphaerochaetaceae bacterium]
RGRGVGGLLLDKALDDAKSRGAYAFVLEVIQENLKAQRLYESHGFSISRSLRCLQKQREAIHSIEPSDSELHIPDADEFLMIAKTIPLPYTPSWQNTNASVTSIFGNLTTRVLNHKGHPVGYFVLYPPTGHVLQLSAKDDNPIIFQELLSHAKAFTDADSLKFINIEETSPFITFLEDEEWTLLIDQYEMIRYFEPEVKA